MTSFVADQGYQTGAEKNIKNIVMIFCFQIKFGTLIELVREQRGFGVIV